MAHEQYKSSLSLLLSQQFAPTGYPGRNPRIPTNLFPNLDFENPGLGEQCVLIPLPRVPVIVPILVLLTTSRGNLELLRAVPWQTDPEKLDCTVPVALAGLPD
eukprot:258096-Rhodomonas_salina.2